MTARAAALPRSAPTLSRLDPRVRFARHEKNKGKTEALKTGFAMTTGGVVIVQDADLEYDSEEIPEVIGRIVRGQADVVRDRDPGSEGRASAVFSHVMVNKALSFLSIQICSPTSTSRRSRRVIKASAARSSATRSLPRPVPFRN